MRFSISNKIHQWCAGQEFWRTTALFIVTLVVLAGCTSSEPAPTTSPPAESSPATAAPAATPSTPTPEQTATAGEVSLANAEVLSAVLAETKGKTLVINVWATFCVPCLEEMPELAQFYKERDPDKVAFLSLSADPAFTVDDVVKPFVAEKSIPFPVYVLDEVPPDTLISLLGVQDSKWSGELPGTFVLDGTGALKHFWLERVHLNDLKTTVESVVNR